MVTPKCQMTVDGYSDISVLHSTPAKCSRTAKYRSPDVQMGVEFICGIHARSLNAMYKRIGTDLRCIPIKGDPSGSQSASNQSLEPTPEQDVINESKDTG